MNDTDFEFKPIELVPVSQWKWHLFAVRYLDHEGGNTLSVTRVVSTDTHIGGGDVWDDAPVRAQWVEWYLLQENVLAPHKVGEYYGMPMYEQGWIAAERMPL